MLPDVNGFQVCQQCEPGCFVPILMLTARAEGDRVQGLHLVPTTTKPFSAKELIARVNALLRRAYSAGYRDVRRNNSVIIGLLPTPMPF